MEEAERFCVFVCYIYFCLMFFLCFFFISVLILLFYSFVLPFLLSISHLAYIPIYCYLIPPFPFCSMISSHSLLFSFLLFSYFLPLVFHLLPLTSRYLPFTFHFLTVTSYFLLIFCVTILRNQASLSRPIQYTATTRSPSYCT